MSDSALNAINHFFDLIDKSVDVLAQAFNRGKAFEGKRQTPLKKQTSVSGGAPQPSNKTQPSKKGLTQPVKKASSARKASFYIVESITPLKTLYVVTDGGKARTECDTRDFAERVLRSLEEAS